jgi:peptidoglycan/LPS O-acetylase OafA/YrhL
MVTFSSISIKAGNHHIKSLDGIRGLAIVLVLALHLFEYFKWFGFGWIGVDLFFVLSGFLITGILLETKGKKNSYKNFIIRRILRIFPLYYLFLTLFFCTIPITNWRNLIPHFEYLQVNQIWFWFYIQNWLAAINDNWPQQNILSHFWSLAIEEQFYVVWPILVFSVPRKNILWICLFLICLSVSLRLYFFFQGEHWTLIYVTTLTRFDGLCSGAMLAWLIRDERGVKFLNRNGNLILLLTSFGFFITFLFAGGFYINNPTLYTVGYTFIALFFCAVVMKAISNHPNNILRSFFESSSLVFLGKYSYGIYIYHLPIYRILQLSFSDTFNNISISTIALLITLVTSIVSFHLFEAQFLKLKDKLSS